MSARFRSYGGWASSPHRSSALFVVLAIASSAQQIRMEPPHDSGQSVTGAFEGWFPNSDGTFSIQLGYYNRNNKQELDIPIGPENKIEPGGPDQGQPTHFLTGRQWGVFTVTVPKDFGSKKLTWTLTANGTTTAIPLNLNSLWELQPLKDATGNTPPFLGFNENGPFVQGPRGPIEPIVTTALKPTPVTLWVADDANVSPGATRPRTPAVTLGWSKFRGPGAVTFSKDHPQIDLLDFAAPLAAPSFGAKLLPKPRSASRANIFYACRPTIGPAKAAEDSNAAGPTPK